MFNNLTGSGENVKWLWPFILLDIILKAFALWRSARRSEKWWFVALLLINTLGILPAFYLLTHRLEGVDSGSGKTQNSTKQRKRK